MRPALRIAPFVVVPVCLGLLSASFAQDRGQSSGASCPKLETTTPVEFCENITSLDSRLPTGVSMSPDKLPVDRAQRMFDCLSWRTFVALNWPADKSCRGIPDSSASLGDGDAPRVWETFKEVFEVFQNVDANWNPSSQDWNDKPPSIQCSAEAGGRKIIHMKSKRAGPDDSATESEQAFATGFGELIDQAGNLVRYEVRFNRDEFEHLKQSGSAVTGKYSYGGPILAADETFALPDNRNGFEGVGAIEIKASWKEMTDADDSSRYYTKEMVIFDAKDTPTCRVATLGLLGLHIGRKLYHAPHMAWMTFEHVDNTPPVGSDGDGRQYSLFSKKCADNQPDACWAIQSSVKESSLACCPNQEHDISTMSGVPIQATRLDPIGPTDLNETFRKLLAAANSPLQHYQLMNTQFTLGARDPDNPDRIRRQFCNPNGPWAIPAAGDDCFTQVPDSLRNTSMETYMAGYGATTIMTASDSCTNCHSAGGVDGSYIWLDAMLAPVPITK